MKSGLSRDALKTISAWSALAVDLGCTLYIPVNPSTRDKEVQDMLAEISRSNATMTIDHRVSDQWSYSIRRGEGLRRLEGEMNVQWKDGLAQISTAGGSNVNHTGTAHIGFDVDKPMFNRAVERSISAIPNNQD